MGIPGADESNQPDHASAGARLQHHQLAPSRWFRDRAQSSVWITGFRVFRVRAPLDLAKQPVVFDFERLRVRLHYYVGDLTYVDFRAAVIRFADAGDGEIRWTPDRSRVTEIVEPQAAYLVVLTPFTVAERACELLQQ